MSIIVKHDGQGIPCDPEALLVTKLRIGVVRKAHLASKAEWVWQGRPACGQITHWRMATGGDLKE